MKTREVNEEIIHAFFNSFMKEGPIIWKLVH